MADFTRQDGVSLEKYIDKQIADLEKSMCLKIHSLDCKVDMIQRMSQTAIDKAEKTVNERLETMNEFRSAMKDLQATYISKDMFEANRQMSDGKLRSLELSKVALDAKADASAVNRAQLLSIISVLLGLAGFIFALINTLGY